MKIKTTLAMIALALTPGWAMAGPGCSGMERIDTTAASCAAGFAWDAEKSACVEQGTS
jgi:hypothetical protein